MPSTPLYAPSSLPPLRPSTFPTASPIHHPLHHLLLLGRLRPPRSPAHPPLPDLEAGRNYALPPPPSVALAPFNGVPEKDRPSPPPIPSDMPSSSVSWADRPHQNDRRRHGHRRPHRPRNQPPFIHLPQSPCLRGRRLRRQHGINGKFTTLKFADFEVRIAGQTPTLRSGSFSRARAFRDPRQPLQSQCILKAQSRASCGREFCCMCVDNAEGGWHAEMASKLRASPTMHKQGVGCRSDI